MRFLRRPVIAWLALTPFVLLFTVSASGDSIQLPANLFGHINQNDITGCTSEAGVNNACGPTSALNSFIFLQNRYRSIYGTSLIPHMNGNTALEDEQAVADSLNCLMGCNPAGGTLYGGFVSGMMAYMDMVAEGKTMFANMNNFVGGNGFPTFRFLFNQLSANEDVELRFNYFNASGTLLGGHYVTLTGINSRTNDGNGTITFVDPAGGMNVTVPTTLNPDGSIRISGANYGPAGTSYVQILGAFAESPVPEPASLMLLLSAGLFAISLAYRRRN